MAGSARPASAADRQDPPCRSPGPGTILLPPWVRAPWLGLRQPSVLLAVVGAAAILACAGSSAALFLSSSSSQALQRFIAARCPDQALPSIGVSTVGRNNLVGPYDTSQFDRVDAAAVTAMRSAGLPRPDRRLVARSLAQAGPAGTTHAPVQLYYGDGALASVDKLQSAGGRGVWISDQAAALWHLRAGGTLPIVVNGSGPPVIDVRVAGVYRDLQSQPTKPYWCSQTDLYHNAGVGNDTFTTLLLFTDPAQFIAVDHRLRDNPTLQWLAPVHDPHVTISQARRLLDRQARARAGLAGTVATIRAPGTRTTGGTELSSLISRTALIRRGLRGPVVPIAIGGSVLALMLIGAAGSYWADRHAREVRLLSSRGVGPGALALKAALELAAPAAVGTAIGWGLAIELVKVLGPSNDLDHAAPIDAALIAAVGFGGGVLLLSVVAGLRARNSTERAAGHGRARLALVPWELVVLAAAATLFLRLRQEPAVTLVSGVAQVNLLLVVCPLLFVAGGAALVVRLIAYGLPLLRRHSDRWPTPWYFAVRRIAGAPVVSVVLLAAASMPVAVLVYAAATTATTQVTVAAKASIYAGAAHSLSTVDPLRRTAAVDRIHGTTLTRYSNCELGSRDAEVLAINPATFAGSAFWDSRFAGRPLSALMTSLTRRPAGNRLPAIVVRYDGGHSTRLRLGSTRKALDIVATPIAFPGQRDQYSDLVVVDAAMLGPVDAMVENVNELWSPAPATAVESAMTAQGARPLSLTTPRTTVESTNYLAVGWTFGYLEALAALVGLVAVGGLLLYLATRQRSRNVSYAMARRMGLSSRDHLRSLLAELTTLLATAWIVGAGLAWIAVLLVYQRLDVDPTRRPPPLLTVPTAALVGSAVAVIVVAVLAALSAQRTAGRADTGEVLRRDA